MARRKPPAAADTVSPIKEEGIITELHIPDELIVDTSRLSIGSKHPWYHRLLTACKTVSGFSWFFIVMTLVTYLYINRANYDFYASLLRIKDVRDADHVKSVLAGIGAVWGLISAAACLLGALIYVRYPEEGRRVPREGRQLLLLSLLSLLMSGLLYFTWR